MNITREISLTATSSVKEGETARGIAVFNAKINTSDPNKITYTSSIIEQTLYRNNREKVKSDQAAFEEVLYTEQDRMITLAQEKQEVTA